MLLTPALPSTADGSLFREETMAVFGISREWALPSDKAQVPTLYHALSLWQASVVSTKLRRNFEPPGEDERGRLGPPHRSSPHPAQGPGSCRRRRHVYGVGILQSPHVKASAHRRS